MLPGVSGHEHVRFQGQGAADVQGIHATQDIAFQGNNGKTDYFRGQIADGGIGNVGQQQGFDLSVLVGRDLAFTP